MSMWRYTAIELEGKRRRSGELSGDSAAQVRAALLKVGLQVIDLRPVNVGVRLDISKLQPLTDRWHKHLRTRRQVQRAEIFDALSTLLSSGLPLLEAVDTLLQTGRSRSSSVLLRDIHEQLRSGNSLSQAMHMHSSWFDAVEVAMVQAAEQSGRLAELLERLSVRHEQRRALMQKLAGAFAYPAIVSVIGLGVAIFLSVQTLPQLTALLIEHEIEVPALTAAVMGLGQGLASDWFWFLPALAVLLAGSILIMPRIGKLLATDRLGLLRRIVYPRLRRQIAAATFCLGLAELLRSGIAMVHALRILQPTMSAVALQRLIGDAAQAIERGDAPAAALADGFFIDAEMQRVLELSEQAGDLDDLLDRIGNRRLRQAQRTIDQLARLLEPAVILVLAALIGIVVMAAILPLVRLQEVM